MASSSIGSWSFHPLVTSFPPTVLPNVGYWNITNGTWEYQVQISWPLNWTSTDVQSHVNTLYVLDGNALAGTATEALRKRRPVDSTQPDTIVVTIGYPSLLPDSPYSQGRYYDYQIPVCANCTTPTLPGVPSNAENFLIFLDGVLRPWITSHVFGDGVTWGRDALFGHSFAGLFAVWALIVRPELFDVYLSASPYLIWNEEYIFDLLGALKTPRPENANGNTTPRLPALQLSYGALEGHPRKRRTETEAEFEERRAFLSSLKTETLIKRLFKEVRDSPRLRHVELLEYPNSYHAAVGSAALCDGVDYFLDW
ncbi:siderophore esteras-like protein IroE-like protein [Westerdykella ornata]|uniref:Siderophore esteras-like protein IroE-like protein n=1 Tax=Westerdykella ornata TaxID=318751 RepID=A0A6A6JEW3_WESOR|nr:siderophore esteras-like protein IroE-like protein [Westerdykella ornata]KAF2274952.1 siderophore esteras-like protein IroE-like protein [Westerdykella ornata]